MGALSFFAYALAFMYHPRNKNINILPKLILYVTKITFIRNFGGNVKIHLHIHHNMHVICQKMTLIAILP
jgi:hypothetical protein